MVIYKKFKYFLQSNFPVLYKFADRKKIIIKFVISGGTAAFIDLSFLYCLTDCFGLWYLISSAIAFAVAFFVSFFLQKLWTFRDENMRRTPKQMFWYFLVAILNLILNAGGMYLLVDVFGVFYLLAQILMGATLGINSFFIYKFIIFKKHKNSKKDERAVV